MGLHSLQGAAGLQSKRVYNSEEGTICEQTRQGKGSCVSHRSLNMAHDITELHVEPYNNDSTP